MHLQDPTAADKVCNGQYIYIEIPSTLRNEVASNVSGDVAQLVRASDRHAADAGSIPRCGKGFFSQSQFSVQTLLRVSVHPRVQSHALTSVNMLKIP